MRTRIAISTSFAIRSSVARSRGWPIALAIAGVLAVTPALLVSQEAWPRADSLSVYLRVDSAALTPSGTALWLSAEVTPGSRQPLWNLFVERHGAVTSARGPNGFRALVGKPDGRATVSWGGAGRIHPGERKGGFFFSGDGLPAVVSFWAVGYYPAPRATPATELDFLLRPNFYDNSFHGTGVGLEPVADVSPSGLLARSGKLLQSACELGWITNAGVCHSLEEKLEQATASPARGNRQAARGQLQAFVQELTARRGPEPGKGVSENAYWLLKPNVESILARL